MKKFKDLIYVHIDCRDFFNEESFTNFSLEVISAVKVVLVKNQKDEIALVVLPPYLNHADGVLEYMMERNLETVTVMGGAWMIVKPSSEKIFLHGASVSFPNIDQAAFINLLSLLSDRYVADFDLLLEEKGAPSYLAHHTRDSLEKIAREAR